MKNKYGEVLRHELILALGCTEPIAIAYAAALARQQLSDYPHKIEIIVSRNIIKNVKGVTVPNTNGRRGIEVAAIAGTLSSKPESKLEVLEYVLHDQIDSIDTLIKDTDISITASTGKSNLYIEITEFSNNDISKVIIEDKHTNVTHLSLNGRVLHNGSIDEEDIETDYDFMSYEGIRDYALNADLKSIIPILEMQIENNYKIAKIGLKENFGMNVGKTLMENAATSKEIAVGYASAGSDARMSGSASPVVINSGSGNQGMTIAIPIYVYSIKEHISEIEMYKALAVANLLAIYQKSKIGSLSAFCGAVSAATAVSGAITYLRGGSDASIKNSIKNAISNLPGVICDGAKPSCAYKIYSSLDSAFMASDLALSKQVAEDGCGIIFEDIDKTIAAVGEIANNGMKTTDDVIIDIMTSW